MDHIKKIKLQQGFKAKYLIISVLSTREYNYVYDFNIVKKVWDTLEMIYEGSTNIKRERMNILVQEAEKQVIMKKIFKDVSQTLKLLEIILKILYLTNI